MPTSGGKVAVHARSAGDNNKGQEYEPWFGWMDDAPESPAPGSVAGLTGGNHRLHPGGSDSLAIARTGRPGAVSWALSRPSVRHRCRAAPAADVRSGSTTEVANHDSDVRLAPESGSHWRGAVTCENAGPRRFRSDMQPVDERRQARRYTPSASGEIRQDRASRAAASCRHLADRHRNRRSNARNIVITGKGYQ